MCCLRPLAAPYCRPTQQGALPFCLNRAAREGHVILQDARTGRGRAHAARRVSHSRHNGRQRQRLCQPRLRKGGQPAVFQRCAAIRRSPAAIQQRASGRHLSLAWSTLKPLNLFLTKPRPIKAEELSTVKFRVCASLHKSHCLDQHASWSPQCHQPTATTQTNRTSLHFLVTMTQPKRTEQPLPERAEPSEPRCSPPPRQRSLHRPGQRRHGALALGRTQPCQALQAAPERKPALLLRRPGAPPAERRAACTEHPARAGHAPSLGGALWPLGTPGGSVWAALRPCHHAAYSENTHSRHPTACRKQVT